MTPRIETDFCVVGGGPAGLTLALLLVRSGTRVVLLERSPSLDRKFRGEILQPSGMVLLDRLGVLGRARARGSHEHDRFQLVDRGRVLIDGDYRKLPGPFNHLLGIPQRHVLEELLAACLDHDGFTYLPGAKATELVRQGGRVTGVVARAPGRAAVSAHCVIGADGRYSKVRRLAGIPARRLDAFGQDVLWFKLPAGGDLPRTVQVFRARGNPVLVHASVPGHVQLGWTLPHGGYQAIAKQGVAAVKARIRAAVPPYADLVEHEIHGLGDLALLDVFAGYAESWVQDGLVLLGDSAHTHSPIGAQGINLAIQDAVALHPVLIESLRERDASACLLGRFEAQRRPEIRRIMKLQVTQSRMMLSAGWLASAVRPKAAALVSRTPVYARFLERIAFGDRTIDVADHLFVSRPPAA
ncbi:FAD-dependent monooxygenase [Amycolatopsis sp. NPDC049688]|uniref:FAD-dependent monooxygenase n=1 Tax=Amycolatopsis sp. NPDC049688 TaxID=3154733 RepID=UPI00342E8DD2